jgi:hypothetical protein
MAKTRPPYPPEFRRQMVELVRAGRSPEELAGVGARSITWFWVRHSRSLMPGRCGSMPLPRQFV